MLDLFAGAALGLLGALILVAQPGLFFRLSRLLELGGRGQPRARVLVAALLAGFGMAVALLTSGR